jgi:hypothetical protein
MAANQKVGFNQWAVMIFCNNNFESVQVECYSGYKTNERPAAFTYRERRWEISEILDRWHEGGLKPDAPVVDYFKVKTDDGTVFLLRYTEHSDAWGVCDYECWHN